MISLEEILKKNKVHFVGIGGVSMSALASFLISKGLCVSGSDLAQNEFTEAVAQKGAEIFAGHDERYAYGCDCLVYTTAIPSDNPELLCALKNGIPVFKREELLGLVFNSFEQRIAVCGMHGKTTTAALIAHILVCCGKNPTAFVGGAVPALGGNLYLGSDKICVAEACEYKRSFLNLTPTINCFLNVNRDHLDYYQDFDDIKSAFRQFAANTSEIGGLKIVNGDDLELGGWNNTVKFGLNCTNDFYANNLKHEKGRFSFEVIRNGETLAAVKLKIPGKHNVYNALCAFCAASFCNCAPDDIKKAIECFDGVDRRFVLSKGTYCDFVVDYAHHPHEVECLLDTVKLLDYRKSFLVFQPHTYTRTKALFSEFVDVFKQADEVVLLPTYSAREKEIKQYDAENLAALFRENGVNTTFLDCFEKLTEFVKQKCDRNDIVLLAGAGDIFKVGKLL